MAWLEVEEAEQQAPEQQLSGFNMEHAEMESIVAQSDEMAEQ